MMDREEKIYSNYIAFKVTNDFWGRFQRFSKLVGRSRSSVARYLISQCMDAYEADKVAIANHMAFFEHQRPDGQIPAYVWDKKVGFGQIQMVVPIAATAWETSQITKNQQLLEAAY